MKRILFFVLCLPLMSSVRGQVSVGVAAGMNIAKVKQEINDDYYLASKRDLKCIGGLVIGIPVEVKLAGKLGLFFMPSYYQKGAHISASGETDEFIATSDGKNVFNYIEMPVQAKIYLVKKKLNVFVLAGPSIGYCLNVHSKFKLTTDYIAPEYDDESLDYDEKLDGKDMKESGFIRWDVSLALGAGVSYKLGPGDLFFNTSYVYGLTDMLDDDNENALGADQFHRGMTAYFGYMLSFPNKD